MAFQFVPNADGSFTEGDKQTNPETGVEYIFSDGGWRPLGPKIEDQFDELDERYLQKAGDTVEGQLICESSVLITKKDDGSKQFKVSPNSGDYYTNIYAFNEGGIRLRSSSTNLEGDYKTFISCGWKEHEVAGVTHPVETSVSWLKTPTSAHHAANKAYVDALVQDSINDLLNGGLPDPPAGEPTPPPVVKPAFMSWIFDGDKTDAESPNSGHFNRHTASTGNRYLRFSFNTNNGIGLGDGKFADTNLAWQQYGPVMSIWEWITINNKNKFKLKRVFYCETLRWNYKPTGQDSAHFEVKVSSTYSMGHAWSNLTEGDEYFVTLGGVF